MIRLLTCILGALSYLIPLCYFLPFKLKFWHKFVFFIILYGNIFLILNILGNAGVIVLLLSASIYISLIDSHRLLNVSVFIATYLFCVLWENIFSLIWHLLGFPVTKLHEKYFLFIIYMSLYIILLNIICPIISHISRRFLHEFKMCVSKNLMKLIAFNLTVCLFIFLFNIIVGEYIGYSPSVITFNSILFGCYFIISFILIANIIKEHIEKTNIEIKQDSYEKLQAYTTQIENMYVSLRTFKHDYANVMLSMSGYIDEEDINGLKKYFYEKISPLSNKLSLNNTNINQLMNIKIIELKSIISTKLLYAEEIGIALNIEVTEEINEVSMDTVDLSRILGIFLDNAIEAALETPEPKLQFAVVIRNKEIVFIVSNNFFNHNIPYAILKKNQNSTKGINRGLGLYNAHTIISQYTNVLLDTEMTEDNFTQRLALTMVSANGE